MLHPSKSCVGVKGFMNTALCHLAPTYAFGMLHPFMCTRSSTRAVIQNSHPHVTLTSPRSVRCRRIESDSSGISTQLLFCEESVSRTVLRSDAGIAVSVSAAISWHCTHKGMLPGGCDYRDASLICSARCMHRSEISHSEQRDMAFGRLSFRRLLVRAGDGALPLCSNARCVSLQPSTVCHFPAYSVSFQKQFFA